MKSGRLKKDGRFKKESKLKFQGRKHSKSGICSMLVALLAMAGLLAASLMSGFAKGEGGIVLGYIGMGCFLAVLFGFILGVRSFKERDILYFHPIFGSIANGILLVIFVVLYLMGAMA